MIDPIMRRNRPTQEPNPSGETNEKKKEGKDENEEGEEGENRRKQILCLPYVRGLSEGLKENAEP